MYQNIKNRTHPGQRAKARQLADRALEILRASESGLRFDGARALGSLALVTNDAEARKTALDEPTVTLTLFLHCVQSEAYFRRK